MAEGKLASVYADALLGLAKSRSSMESVEEELHAVAALLLADEDIWKFFKSPVISPDEKIKIIEKAIKPKVSEELFNFLGVLALRTRLEHLFDIGKSYTELLDKELNRRRVSVETAEILDDGQMDALKQAVKSFLDAGAVVLNIVENPELIGGMKIRTGDVMIDTSLRSGLDRIKARLIQRKTIGEEYYEN